MNADTIKTPNLFGCLYKWAHRQDENFVTEGLVYVLNLLLEQEPDVAVAAIRWLLDLPTAVVVRVPQVVVKTQWSAEEGRPDILIETPDCFAVVEVKKESGLGESQLERYRKLVNRKAKGRMARLVLITRYPVASAEGEESPDVHRRWHDVATFLAAETPKSPIASFVVRQFIGFLEDQVMAAEHVNWQYIEGFRAFRNLLNMLATAIEEATLPNIASRATGWGGDGWTGYYSDKSRYWIGIRHQRPNFVQFCLERQTDIDIDRFKRLCEVQNRNDKFVVELQLDSEESHFFARSKESQLALLTKFLRETRQAANSCLLSPVTAPRA